MAHFFHAIYNREPLHPKPADWITLGSIMLLGLILRLWGLGANNFDFDEFGVISVVSSPSLIDALQNSRNHVMPMPFDYIIAWLLARFSTDEAFMRLSSVAWGTITILPAYFLYKRLSNRKVALLACLLLALSPFLIQYSQELRFYASLVFFYLLSLWLFLWAIDQNTRYRWLLFSGITILGIFFHVYTAFILSNVMVWYLFSHKKLTPETRLYIIRSVICILAAFLIGIILFAVVNPESLPLVLDQQSILEAIAVGLGILPFYPTSVPFSLGFGFVTLFLSLVGILTIINLRREDDYPLLLVLSSILQIILIVSFDYLKKYFFAPRHILFLLPVWIYFSGIGLKTIIDLLTRKSAWFLKVRLPIVKLPHISVFFHLVVLVFIFLTSLPALANYYGGDKGKVEDVIQVLSQHWQPGERVIVMPSYNYFLFLYYLKKNQSDPVLIDSMVAADLTKLDSLDDWHTRQFFIITDAPTYQAEEIRSIRLVEPLFIPETQNHYSQFLWVENRINPESNP
jgi:4-amino-4-deoxy-L-arabinose transferase-like glycosyltransferase